jgi:hypothetical protein
VDAKAILYTRTDCPLCFALARSAMRSSRRHGIRLVEVDVDADPSLRALYGDRVPVLELPGGGSLSGRAPAREVDEAFRLAAGAVRPGRARPRGGCA